MWQKFTLVLDSYSLTESLCPDSGVYSWIIKCKNKSSLKNWTDLEDILNSMALDGKEWNDKKRTFTATSFYFVKQVLLPFILHGVTNGQFHLI